MTENVYDHKIKVDEVFEDWTTFQKNLKDYEKHVKQLFVRHYGRTLKNNPIEGANEKCSYVNVRLNCKYGPHKDRYQNKKENDNADQSAQRIRDTRYGIYVEDYAVIQLNYKKYVDYSYANKQFLFN